MKAEPSWLNPQKLAANLELLMTELQVRRNVTLNKIFSMLFTMSTPRPIWLKFTHNFVDFW